MKGGQNKKGALKAIGPKDEVRQHQAKKPKTKPLFSEKAPRGSGKYYREFWNKYAPKLAAAGVLRESDRASWEILCGTYETIKECEELIKEHGLLIPGARGNGEMVKNPAVSILNAARQQYRLQAAEFGLSPQARERLEISEPDELSPMGQFLKNRREKDPMEDLLSK